MNTRARYFSNHIFDAFHLWSVSYIQLHNIHRATYHPNLPSDLFFFDLIYHVTCPTPVYAVTIYQHSDYLLALSPSKCFQRFILPINFQSFCSWLGRGMDEVLTGCLLRDDCNFTQSCCQYSDKAPTRFQKSTGHVGTEGFVDISSVSLNKHLSYRNDN